MNHFRRLAVAMLVLSTLFGLGNALANPALAQAGERSLFLPNPDVRNASPHAEYLQRAGAWPFGSAHAVVLDEGRNLAFLSSGGAVLVLDITDPLSPTLVSDAVQTLGYVEDLFYEPSDQYLYIAAGEGGMEIWDVQTSTLPVRLSVTELYYAGVEIPVEGIAVQGNMAYVAANWGFLHWVNVSDPTNPFQVGYDDLHLRPLDLTASGGYVYATGDSFVKYFIQPDGSLLYADERALALCVPVVISGTYAYVGCTNLYILNITVPGMPLVGTFPAGGVYDLAVLGDYAYIANGYYGLLTLNISDPANPIEESLYDTPGWADGIAAVVGYTYIADSGRGLQVVDVSDPTDPSQVGHFETASVNWSVTVSDNYAYLAEDDDGVIILDVSNPVSPTLVGQYDTPSYTYDVAVQGGYAYVADLYGGLRIADISDPTNPIEVGFDDTFDAWRVDVSGDYAYVIDAITNQPYWLRVFDVSNPISPTEVGAVELLDNTWDIVVSGDYVFVAADDFGLRIVDVSDPTNPALAGFYDTPDVWDVFIQGEYAFVASVDVTGGFLILDISDPTDPTLVSLYNPFGWFQPYKVAVFGSYAYASLNDDLYLLDISDLTNPVEVEFVTLPRGISNLDAAGPYVYAAANLAGLQIYENLLPLYDATLGPDSVVDTLPGSSIVHDFTLQNIGVTDRYTLTVGGNAWPTTLLTNSPITVPEFSAATVTVQVDVPEVLLDVLHGTDRFTLTAASAGDPSLVLTTTGTTNAVTNPDVALTPPAQARAGSPGAVVTHTFTVTNAGDYTDTFALTLTGNIWDTVGPASAGPLGPGEAATVGVWVSIPTQPASGGVVNSVIIAADHFTLTASSGLDDQITAQATGTTSAVVNPGVALAPPAQTKEGRPETFVTHTFTVTNAGDYSDTFALTIAGNSWETLGPASIGPLGPGDAAAVQITVTLPPAPVPGGALDSVFVASDRFTLTAVSGLDDQVIAQATGTTQAVVNPAVSWSSDQAGSGTVGTEVRYVLTITNSGDYVDNFTLTVAGNWPASLSAGTTGPLLPGTGTTVTLTVLIPLGIADGDQDVTVLTATSGWDMDVSANAQVVTTGYWWRSFLPLLFRGHRP